VPFSCETKNFIIIIIKLITAEKLQTREKEREMGSMNLAKMTPRMFGATSSRAYVAGPTTHLQVSCITFEIRAVNLFLKNK